MIGRNDWTGLKYHIIFKNSIEFANKLCYYLCGKNIPPWINCFPIIYQKHSEVIVEIPEEFRTPVALKEMIQQKLEFAHKLQQQPKQQKAIVSTNANDNQNDGKGELFFFYYDCNNNCFFFHMKSNNRQS